MEQSREYDEEDGFLTGEPTAKVQQYERTKISALIAYSNLRSIGITMLLCLVLFLGIVTLRMELQHTVNWPIYVDFAPMVIFSLLVYLAAMDFAATHTPTEFTLGKIVAVTTGFLFSFGLVMLMILISLRIDQDIKWRWTNVMFPFWMGLLFSQFFFCFLIQGFLREKMLPMLFVVFGMVWMFALTVLLTGLKLDKELTNVHWWTIFIPIWIILLAQIAFLEKTPMDVACRVVLLISGILLPLQLDKAISWPWAVILCPAILVLLFNIAQIFSGTEKVS